MCIIDGNVDCIINPISNAIYNIIYPFFEWIINIIYSIFVFIYNIGTLLYTVLTFITGLLSYSFNSNPYAAVVFGLVLTGISIVVYMRIYNIISGVELFGFKLPKI